MGFISWLATTRNVLHFPEWPKWLLQECLKGAIFLWALKWTDVVHSCILYITYEIYWLELNYSYNFVLFVILCSKCIELHFTMDIYKPDFENERNLEMLIFGQRLLLLFIKYISKEMELNESNEYVRKLYEYQRIISLPFATSYY